MSILYSHIKNKAEQIENQQLFLETAENRGDRASAAPKIEETDGQIKRIASYQSRSPEAENFRGTGPSARIPNL